MNDSVPPIELPPCELGRLEEISELVSSCLPSPIRREKLAIAIENEVYIKKLLNLFHMCEDLDNTEGLHHLYEIFKNIFLLVNLGSKLAFIRHKYYVKWKHLCQIKNTYFLSVK